MGQPTLSNVFVQFDTCANATPAIETFKEWADKAHDHLLPEPAGADKNGSINGDYCIENIHGDDNEITFTVSSARCQNCIWQCENIKEFFTKQKGYQSFDAVTVSCEKSVNWFLEEYDEGDTEEQQRRDEKNGLYGDKVDPAN